MSPHRQLLRRWTEAEQQKLYRDYFALLPGICPVCGNDVNMVMEHKDGAATVLKLRCRGCGNKAEVTV